MRWVKFAAIVSLWAIFFGLVVVVHLWISLLKLPNRWEIISRLTYSFSFLLRTILNIKVTVAGDAGQIDEGDTVIIANHLGYVDGFVLGSIFPVVFVSKREVKKWPVIGLWATLGGTIFINRQKKGEVGLLVVEMSKKLRDGANILLFPEGRATNGERMLPFQTDDNPLSKENRDLIYCYDDMDFFPHFWKLLSLRSIEVVVTIQRKIECSRYKDNSAGRKKLALDCYNRVLGRVNILPN